MQKVIVRQLRLGTQGVGYRFDLRDGNRRIIAIDVTSNIASAVMKMFEPSKVQMGSAINGVMRNGVFVTSNEEAVMEAPNLDVAEELLAQHYFGKFDSLDEKLELEKTSEAERVKREQEYLKYLKSQVTGRRPNLQGFEFGNFCDVPVVYDILLKAAQGVDCNIMCREQRDAGKAYMYFGCVFMTLQDVLKFVYNLNKILRRGSWICNLYSKKSEALNTNFMCVKADASKPQEVFVTDVLYSLKLKSNQRIFAKDFKITGTDSIGSYSVHKGEMYLATYAAPIPEYNADLSNMNKYRCTKFKFSST